MFCRPVVEPLTHKIKSPFSQSFVGDIVHFDFTVYEKAVGPNSTGPLIRVTTAFVGVTKQLNFR